MTFLRNLPSSIILLLALVFTGSCARNPPSPTTNAHIRFYSINDFDQLSDLSLVPNRDEAGCHNMPIDLEVHRIAQIGFDRCQVFNEADCAEGSALTVRWSGKKSRSDPNKNEPTQNLTQGSLWQFAGAREATISSWRCDLLE